MKTIHVSPEEMEARTARFGQITPQSTSYAEDTGIPKEAYEMLTAKTLYLLMSPESQGGPMAQAPAVTTADKMSVIIAECPPGDRPLLHAHHKTNETFFCLNGRFRIRWGDEGENETYLEPLDDCGAARRGARLYQCLRRNSPAPRLDYWRGRGSLTILRCRPWNRNLVLIFWINSLPSV